MAKDFCFMFYPGDYLQDTQCLSENVQVAYDRIMCEHMRNICITQAQLKFFTKKLSEEEKQELSLVLKEVDGGFQIEWVAKSIVKRLEYSESRSKNREGKTKNTENHIKIISKSYVTHIEDRDIIKDEIVINIEFEVFWNLYDKKVGEKGKLKKMWLALSDQDRLQAIDHIPKYKQAQPDKKFRKDPQTYLNNKSFNDEIINSTNGQRTNSVGSGQLGTSAARIKALKEW